MVYIVDALVYFFIFINLSLSLFQTLKKSSEKEKKKSNLELFKEELKQYVLLHS